MSFLNVFFNFTMLLFNVSWFHTEIDIPLGGDVYEYLEKVEANLYENGELIRDARVSYKYNGVNRTFASTIKTTYVKTYTLYIQAYFEDQDVKDIIKLEINVCDLIAPLITHIPSHTISYGDKLPDFKALVEYSDNYDEKTDLILHVDASNINESRLGTYEIIYSIIDKSFNERTYKSYFTIEDRIAPTIKLNKKIIVEVHQMFIADDFIKVSDNYDLNVSVEIIDAHVNYSKLGEYEIKIKAIDMSKNSTMDTFLITIVDKIPPELILKSNAKPITVYKEIDISYLKTYILSLSDNYDTLSLDDVHITHDIDSTRLGSYHIYFSCMDRSQNITNQSLKIIVVDDIRPEIEMLNPLIFDVFSQDIILSDYFIITDNYNILDDLEVKYKHAYNLNKLGRYQISVEVKDKSLNKTIFLTDLLVIDQTPPEITQTNDIMITDFQKQDLSIYFKAFDLYDQDGTNLSIDDQHVNYLIKGSYDIIIYASDQSDNTAEYRSKVHLIDISSPKLELSIKALHMGLKEDVSDFKSYILNVSDNYDELNVDDVIIESNININEMGLYEITYKIVDSSFNETIETIDVYVDDFEAPVIFGDSLYIKTFESLDLLKDLNVSDQSGIYKIYYQPFIIDTSYPGTYEINYLVMDNRGNESSFSRLIYIEEAENKYQVKDFTPVIITLISSISLLYYLYKKL